MQKKQSISDELYDKVCKYCLKANRDIPYKSDTKEIQKIIEHMRMLGEL